MNGPGILIRRNGERYVGEFVVGEISGAGIEYSSLGVIKQSGFWEKGVLRAIRSLDPSMFPFSLNSSLREYQKNKNLSQNSLPDVAGQLKRALEELQAAKAQNIELQRELNELKKNQQTRGSDVVQACLSRGLRPGSPQFSECIGNGN